MNFLDTLKKYWIAIVLIFAICMFVKPAACPIILGAVAICITVFALSFQNRINKEGIETGGKIIKYVRSGSGHQTPFIEYKTSLHESFQGKPFVYSSTDLSIVRSYRTMIGKEVRVKYDPANPERFVLVGEEGLNAIVFLIVGLVGLAFFLVGIAALFKLIEIDWR